MTIINLNDYYFFTKYKPKCIDAIKEELKNTNWYISPYNTERSDLSKELRSHLQSVLPFKISDAGFLRRRPISIYDPHVDPARTFALNILLTELTPGEGTFVLALDHDKDNAKKFNTSARRVPMVQDYVTVLNVKKIHYVVNHTDHDRIILSIGCNDTSYEEFISNIGNNLSNL